MERHFRSSHHFSSLDSLVQRVSHTQFVVVADEKVWKIWGKEIEPLLPCGFHLFTVPEGEKAKSLSVAEHLWREFYAAGIQRRALLIGVGGGATCDLANFVAGCYLRGIDCALMPTTLLAMVDAAIGGKCGVNLLGRKNLIGLFREPHSLIVNPRFLETLSEREQRAGIAEIVKAAILGDGRLFRELERWEFNIGENNKLREIVSAAMTVKEEIVHADPFESKGRRTHLNLGHTFAHAIETLSGHTLSHGEAVAIGLSCALHLSQEILPIPPTLAERVDRCLERYHLPTHLPADLAQDELLQLMKGDKKNIGEGICFVLLRDICRPELVTLHDLDPVRKVLERRVFIE